MIEEIFKLSNDVRYVAIYKNGKLETKSKENTEAASDSESDKYEELICVIHRHCFTKIGVYEQRNTTKTGLG